MGTAIACLVNSKFDDSIVDIVEQTAFQQTQSVREMWQNSGFHSLPERIEWVQNLNTSQLVDSRPRLPSVKFSLRDRTNFHFTFGSDAVCIYHPLVIEYFVQDENWQNSMLNAFQWFVEISGANSAIVTREDHPIIQSFFEKKRYDDCFDSFVEADGEVKEISQMHLIGEDGFWDSRGFWRISI